jgi:hypothetical protein
VTTSFDAAAALRLAPIAIIVEGGILQSVLTRNPARASAVVVIDLDADDEDTNASLTDPSGHTVRACISVQRPDQADLVLKFEEGREDRL